MHGFCTKVCEQHGGKMHLITTAFLLRPLLSLPRRNHHQRRRRRRHRGSGGKIGGRKPRENQHYVAQWSCMKLLRTLSLYRVIIALLGTTSVLVVW